MTVSKGNLTRRTFLKATGFGAAAAAVSACVAPAPAAGDEAAPAAEQIDLDYWYIWGGRGGEGQVAGCDLFTELNPNITMHPLTAGGVIVDKTLAAFAAGDPPDLVDLIFCAPLAGRGALIAVDDYIERFRPHSRLGAGRTFLHLSFYNDDSLGRYDGPSLRHF